MDVDQKERNDHMNIHSVWEEVFLPLRSCMTIVLKIPTIGILFIVCTQIVRIHQRLMFEIRLIEIFYFFSL